MKWRFSLLGLLLLSLADPSLACWDISATDNGHTITVEVTVTPSGETNGGAFITVEREILEYCQELPPEIIEGSPVRVPRQDRTVHFSLIDPLRFAGKSYRYRLVFVDNRGVEIDPSRICPRPDDQRCASPPFLDLSTRDDGLIFLGEGIPRKLGLQYLLEPCGGSCVRPYDLYLFPSTPYLLDHASENSLPVIVYGGQELFLCDRDPSAWVGRLWWVSCTVANENHTWSSLKARY